MQINIPVPSLNKTAQVATCINAILTTAFFFVAFAQAIKEHINESKKK